MVTDSVTLDEKRKGLSKRESYLLSYLSERGKEIFNLEDVTGILGCRYENAKVIVERLIRKRWVERLSKGRYMIIPLSAGVEARYSEHEFVIASLFPGYVSYWSALNYHGLTEQIPDKVFVASTKRLRNRRILGVELKFVFVSKKKFFGFEEIRIMDNPVRISDREKTIVDCLDRPRYCGGIEEVVKALSYGRDEIDFEKLKNYALRIGNNSAVRRVGFILEYLGLDTMGLERNVGKGYSPLDPTRERKGRYSSRWGILINIPEKMVF
jgi:predicted transcriptional regulator of viral defense system